MAFLIRRFVLFILMILLNACVYHPHPFYGGGYGGAYYEGGYHDHHYRGDGGHRHGGRRHH